MKLTMQIIHQGASVRGGWSTRQLRLLGVAIPLTKGWKQRLVGKEVADKTVAEFLRLKDAHTKQSDLKLKDGKGNLLDIPETT